MTSPAASRKTDRDLGPALALDADPAGILVDLTGMDAHGAGCLKAPIVSSVVLDADRGSGVVLDGLIQACRPGILLMGPERIPAAQSALEVAIDQEVSLRGSDFGAGHGLLAWNSCRQEGPGREARNRVQSDGSHAHLLSL